MAVEERVRVAEILGAFAIAGDLGRGQPEGHVLRSVCIALQVADKLGLSTKARGDVYYTTLLMHCGCTAGAAEFAAVIAGDELAAQRDLCLCDPRNLGQCLTWIRRHVAPDAGVTERARRALQLLVQGERTMAGIEQGCSDVGARIAHRLRMSEETQRSLYHICELWNGKGPHQVRGADIPIPARIANAAMTIEVFSGAQGREGAMAAARKRRGKSFDPDVADAFLALAGDEAFWEPLAADDLWQTVLAMEPSGPRRYLDMEDLDEVALAFADFTDLKSTRTATHSRRTAEVAEAVARRLGRMTDEVVLTRRAALVHDLGQVAVPSLVLDKSGPLTEGEQERLRLHPYYTERILARVPALGAVASVAAMHHERLDGRGYHRGLSEAHVPLPARILAVASTYVDLTGERPNGAASEPESVLRAMEPEVGRGLDGDCYRALLDEVGGLAVRPLPRREWPAGLTDREVEVLQLVARGLDRRQVAERLFVSEHTVRHHLESIYSKIDVHSRAGAVLFAVEQQLLS
jgi:HD-GYP domain-containing protein (c-di-GMP phosphodiesterase class II)/DNA-binding CsgD family transcriptional regulator